jgi:hypothetical protein
MNTGGPPSMATRNDPLSAALKRISGRTVTDERGEDFLVTLNLKEIWSIAFTCELFFCSLLLFILS